jgi:hypothetical protein
MSVMQNQARSGKAPRTGYWIIPCCLLILILAGAGCLGTKTPESAQIPPAVLVDYHRTGGIAGIDDRLVIFDNGVAVISGRSGNTEILLTQNDLALIAVLFNQSQFSQLQTQYSAPGARTDLMTYTISYHGKTVTAEESAVPPSLLPVIADLNQILATAGAQKTAYPTLPVTPA